MNSTHGLHYSLYQQNTHICIYKPLDIFSTPRSKNHLTSDLCPLLPSGNIKQPCLSLWPKHIYPHITTPQKSSPKTAVQAIHVAPPVREISNKSCQRSLSSKHIYPHISAPQNHSPKTAVRATYVRSPRPGNLEQLLFLSLFGQNIYICINKHQPLDSLVQKQLS